MSCFIKRALPFVLTLTIGLLIGSLFGSVRLPKYEVGQFVFHHDGGGDYRHHCHRDDFNDAYDFNAPVIITRKPEAVYTARARRDAIMGTVKLRVTFSSDGTVSDVVPIEGLSGGLTEEAMKAARRIEFKPAYISGHPTDATQDVGYYFNGDGPLSSSPPTASN